MCCEGGCGGGVPGWEWACGVLCGRVGDCRKGGIGAGQGCVGWDMCLSGVWCACVWLGMCGGVLGRGGAADLVDVPLLGRAGGPRRGFLGPKWLIIPPDHLPRGWSGVFYVYLPINDALNGLDLPTQPLLRLFCAHRGVGLGGWGGVTSLRRYN